MTKQKVKIVRYVALIILCLIGAQSGRGNTIIWSGASSTTFAAAGNWDGGVVPVNSSLAAGDIARFTGPVVRSPKLDSSRSLYGLIFESAGWTLDGAESTLTVGNSGIRVTNAASSACIAPALKLNGVQSWVIDSGASMTVAGAISGSVLTKAGGGELFLGGAYSSTSFIMTEGSVCLQRNDLIGDTVAVRGGGGASLLLDGKSDTAGMLSVLAGGLTIDFGSSGANALVFAASSKSGWLGTLTVLNFESGVDRLRFGTDATGLSSDQISKIKFGTGGLSAQIDSQGFVTPGKDTAEINHPVNMPLSKESDFAGTSGKVKIGAYFFNDWYLLPQRMKDDFPEREPVWGYKEGTLSNMESQIKFAVDAGLSFWSFCWYIPENPPQNWRGRTGLTYKNHPLNEALRLYLQSKGKKDLKFCLLVANTAPYSVTPSNWNEVVQEWVSMMQDESYLKADGQPLLIMYSPQSMVEKFGDTAAVRKAFDYLRSEARRAGLPGVRIAVCSHEPTADLEATGYDAYTGYHFRWMANPGWGRRGAFEEMASAHRRTWDNYPAEKTSLPVIPLLAVGWDDRSRSREEVANTFFWWYDDPTPDQLYRHVSEMKQWLGSHPERCFKDKIGLMYAWNEMGEGGYMVPTKGRGNKFLDVIKAALSGSAKPPLDDAGFVSVALPDGLSLKVPGEWLRIYGGTDGPLSNAPSWELDFSVIPPSTEGQKALFRAVAPRKGGFALVDISATRGPADTGAAFYEKLKARLTDENTRLIDSLPVEESTVDGRPCQIFQYRQPSRGGTDVTCRVVQICFGEVCLKIRFVLSDTADARTKSDFQRMTQSIQGRK